MSTQKINDIVHGFTKLIPYISFCIAVSTVSGLFYAISLALSLKIFSNNKYLFLFSTCIGLVATCIIIPYVIFKYIKGDKDYSIKSCKKLLIRLLIEELLIFIFCRIINIELEIVIFYMFIGICEEYLFRVKILGYLEKYMKQGTAWVLTSLLFALIFHANCSFISNILVRFPLAIIFTLIRKKVGYSEACVTHSLYNIIIGLI